MMKTLSRATFASLILWLAACETTGQSGADTAVRDLAGQAKRDFADTFKDTPFDAGPVSVVTRDSSGLRTYTLTPCQTGVAVCGAQAGQLQRNSDYYIVTGAYEGRSFYLSPGGDGYLKQGADFTPLAWN